MSDDTGIIGHVVGIDGHRVTCLLDNAALDGQELSEDAPRIGMLVRMASPVSTVYGVIASMAMNPFPGAEAKSDNRFAHIDMMGEALTAKDGAQRFERGVSIYPTLGASVRKTDSEDVGLVYAKPTKDTIRVGTIHQNENVPAYVMTDDLLAKHMAILGTTGSGKSCTVTLLLRAILAANPAGHVVLLDPHNEYGAAFGDMAELVNPSNLYLPYWLLNFEEMVTVLVTEGDATEKQSQIAILRDAVTDVRKAAVEDPNQQAAVTVDTPVPYRLSELIRVIDSRAGKLDKADDAKPFLRLTNKLKALTNDKRYQFMFSGLLVRDTLANVLSQLLRVPVQGKPLTVMDLSGVPSEIVDVVVSVVCRLAFDFGLWASKFQAVPVMVVCEEAHRYIPREDNGRFTATRKAIAQIAKEGRKYGVSLCLISQRPSELDESILSQCGTLFSLRMGNDRDQEFVAKAMPENAQSLMAVLPSLRTREAIAVGEGVTVPMRIHFDELPPNARPRSGSAKYSHAWQQDREGAPFLYDTIDRWRFQQR